MVVLAVIVLGPRKKRWTHILSDVSERIRWDLYDLSHWFDAEHGDKRWCRYQQRHQIRRTFVPDPCDHTEVATWSLETGEKFCGTCGENTTSPDHDIEAFRQVWDDIRAREREFGPACFMCGVRRAK